MARRSAVQHGPETAAHEGAGLRDPWDPTYGDGAAGALETGRRTRGRGAAGGSGGGRWAGSGGRWWVWLGRLVLWALIIVIVVNGVRAPFERFTSDGSGGTATPRADAKSRFPATAASAYALEFTGVYLNYDQRSAADRQRQLQYFLPAGTDTQFGWNGVGQLQIQAVEVAGVDAKDANNAIVTVLARTRDRWFQLAVPVYAKDGALAITGRPALLPPPARAALPPGSIRERDSAIESELQPVLDGFFKAYASDDRTALARFADQTTIVGLAGAVNFVQVREVIAPSSSDAARTVYATVAWQVAPTDPKGAGGELEQSYELTVVKKEGTWYVRGIRGSTRPMGS